MRVVYCYKYEDDLELPKGYIIRHIGLRKGDHAQDVLTVWAEVDPNEKELVNTHLLLLPTGVIASSNLLKTYIGTVRQEQFIWHFYQGE